MSDTTRELVVYTVWILCIAAALFAVGAALRMAA